MKKLSEIHKILAILMLILIVPSMPSIFAYPCYGFGTKVTFYDVDAGNPLNYCCHDFGFRDIGTVEKVYDELDSVYLDMDADGTITIDDIRITPFAIYVPGSKVTRNDVDINAPLCTLNDWSIAYVDLNGDNVYSIQDALYLHNMSCGCQIVSGDIRLTFFERFLPGTRVRNFDLDANLFAFDLMGITAYLPNQTVAIRFFNANGNYREGSAVYDWPDAVYLHILDSNDKNGNGVVGFVGSNDLRLSI